MNFELKFGEKNWNGTFLCDFSENDDVIMVWHGCKYFSENHVIAHKS